jgi:uncharacterized transporter YbjL
MMKRNSGWWSRTLPSYPAFGAIPGPAQRLLADFGLIVFIALIGLGAGPHAIDALNQLGPCLATLPCETLTLASVDLGGWWPGASH